MTQVGDIAVQENPQYMALGEAKAFGIDFTNYGTQPGAVHSVKCYSEAGTDVSATLLSGSASVSGYVCTCPVFTPATAGFYRIIAIVDISSNDIIGEIDINVVSATAPPTVTNGYITLREFKDFAKIAQSDQIEDAMLATVIMAASRVIDDLTGRTFYSRTETHYYNTPEGDTLFFYDDDLLTVTTLTNGDTTVISSSYYKLYPLNASPKFAIVLKGSSGLVWSSDTAGDEEGAITVAGTWGYSSTAPEDIKLACKEIVMSAYKRRFGETYDVTTAVTAGGVLEIPQELPGTARRLLEKYRRIV